MFSVFIGGRLREYNSFFFPCAAELDMAAEADVRPGSHNEWTQHAVVQGWAAVEEQLESLAHAQCQGASMKVVSVRDHAKSVVYKYGCGFFYSHKCKWCCRVVFAKEGSQQILRNVDHDHRAQYHAQHNTIIELGSRPHCNHVARAAGPCKAFTAKARADKSGSMLKWTSGQIMQWMKDHHIEHDTPHDLKYLVARTKRWCAREAKRSVMSAVLNNQNCIDSGAEEEVWFLNMQFATVSAKADFTATSSYIVPGSVYDRHRPEDNFVMITTVHNMLNLARAVLAFKAVGMLPPASIDHTFKVVRPFRLARVCTACVPSPVVRPGWPVLDSLSHFACMVRLLAKTKDARAVVSPSTSWILTAMPCSLRLAKLVR